MKILLVEDEKRMADAVSELLRQEHYEVDVFYDGIAGTDAIETGIYDAAVLDVMLPGKSGFDIISDARKAQITTPTLMLTAKSDVHDKVTGLDCGADDYLTKPFEVEELLARIRALCRRGSRVTEGMVTAGDLVLYTKTDMLCCTASGLEVRLSEKEYKIMEYLMANLGQIISKERLSVKVWGFENEAEYNNVEVYISFTRKKLAFLQSKTEIKAVRGMGYELKMYEG